MEFERKQDLNVLYHVCVFRPDRKNKMASDLLKHFWLLLRNCSTESKGTWQEARSKHPLPSLCFLGRLEKQDGQPGWDIFYFSSSTTEQNSMKLDRKQDLNVLYQVCIFRTIKKQDGYPVWSVNKGGTFYSGARYVALWAPCSIIWFYKKRILAKAFLLY